MDTSVARGYATVQSATTPGTQVAPGATCWAPIRIRGPYNGADPITRFFVGDVPRDQNGGPDPSKAFLNVVKAQAAMEALVGAGVTSPTFTQAKANGRAVPATMVVHPNGSVVGGTYGDLSTAYNTPYTGVFTSAANYGAFNTPGNLIASLPSGHALVSAIPPADTWAAKPGNLVTGPASLAAQAANTNPILAPLGTDIWSTLYVNGETLPGVSLFGVPTYPGDIANLHYTGADIAAVSATDPLRSYAEANVAVGEYASPFYGGRGSSFNSTSGSGPGHGSAPPAPGSLAAVPGYAAPPSARNCTFCSAW